VFHANAPGVKLQEEILELLRLPLQKTPRKKIKKDQVTLQLSELIKFLQGNYL